METQEKIDNKNLINGKKDEQVCGGHEGLCCEHNCKPKEDNPTACKHNSLFACNNCFFGGKQDNRWEEGFDKEFAEHFTSYAPHGKLKDFIRQEIVKDRIERGYEDGIAVGSAGKEQAVSKARAEGEAYKGGAKRIAYQLGFKEGKSECKKKNTDHKCMEDFIKEACRAVAEEVLREFEEILQHDPSVSRRLLGEKITAFKEKYKV